MFLTNKRDGRWVISTTWLNVLLHLHLSPINQIIFLEPHKDFLSWGLLRT